MSELAPGQGAAAPGRAAEERRSATAPLWHTFSEMYVLPRRLSHTRLGGSVFCRNLVLGEQAHVVFVGGSVTFGRGASDFDMGEGGCLYNTQKEATTAMHLQLCSVCCWDALGLIRQWHGDGIARLSAPLCAAPPPRCCARCSLPGALHALGTAQLPARQPHLHKQRAVGHHIRPACLLHCAAHPRGASAAVSHCTAVTAAALLPVLCLPTCFLLPLDAGCALAGCALSRGHLWV